MKKRKLRLLFAPVFAVVFSIGWILYVFGRRRFPRLRMYLTCTFHIAGISSLLGASLVMCWVFYTIAGKQQVFRLYENTAWVRYSECVLVAIGVLYAFWLMVTFIKRASK